MRIDLFTPFIIFFDYSDSTIGAHFFRLSEFFIIEINYFRLVGVYYLFFLICVLFSQNVHIRSIHGELKARVHQSAVLIAINYV